MRFKKIWIIGIVFLALAFLSVRTSLSVNAEDQPNTTAVQAPSGRMTTFPLLRPTINPTEYILRLTGKPGSEMPDGRPFPGPSGALGRKLDRLTDHRLQACQSVSKNITKRSVNLTNQVAEMEKKFTSIAAGVEKYYQQKVVPTGVTLSNYDALVADITTRANAVTPLLTVIQADAADFICTGDNPSAQLKQFSTDMRAVLHALQEYRTGIHNLIVAIRALRIPEPTITPTTVPTLTSAPTIEPTAKP